MVARERNRRSEEQTAPQKTAQPANAQNTDTIDNIDLVELFYRLVEKIKWIIAAALVGALLAYAYTIYVITPLYTTTSKLYVVNTNDSAINISDLQLGSYLTADYKEVFKIWHVHEMVIEKLGLPYSYQQLSSMITVTNPSDSRILYITVTSPDPDEAKSIADTYAQVAKEFIAKAMESEEPNVIQEALRPTSPTSPSKSRNVMMGFLLGIALSCGVITLKFITDDRIRNSEDISRYLNLTTLGMLPMQDVGQKSSSTKHGKRGKSE